ncbi:acid protease [Patellaria atrata CBS 101060]|uniref:Acid protease n=1 Tax=Patellaria atrata CBS 101060 TaxID=1346257 RepID=A0A9P4VS91_9PEZI|nr:acid protease [Patellaria atrata CBS 101060]
MIPLDISPSQQWGGNDGPWSTFTLSVGTPPQRVQALINIGYAPTWFVIDDGCGSDPPDCERRRGGLIDTSLSETWETLGIYSLTTVDDNADPRKKGIYGLDTVSLSSQIENSPSLNQTLVAGLETRRYMLGQVSINPKTTGLRGNSYPGFLSLLKKEMEIPSLSYAYTAGSYHRSKSVESAFASLMLGGYDSSQTVPNSVSFPFIPGGEQEFVVTVQSITISSPYGQERVLIQDPFRAALDTQQPHIWVPSNACHSFLDVLDLSWNETNNLFFPNGPRMEDQDKTLIFTLSADSGTGAEINISLPLESFDLIAESPLVEIPASYVPLQCTDDQDKYRLGRVFFQEAYFVADYERRNFSLFQRDWETNAEQAIIPIESAAGPKQPTTKTGKLSSERIIGIIMAILVIIICGSGIIYFMLLWWKKYSKASNKSHRAELCASTEKPVEADIRAVHHEVDGHSTETVEIHGHQLPAEAEDTGQPPVFELPGSEMQHELAT